jgi:hypothetical protein
LEGSFPPPRPDLLQPTRPPPPPTLGRPSARWLLALAVGLLLVAVPIAAVVLLDDDTQEPRRPITSRTPTPTAPPPSPEPTSLETMELRLGTRAPGAPAGWRRWRASDGSFSFAGPLPDAPLEPAFDGSLWEVTIDGSLMTFYLYASDNYLDEDVDATIQLESIADGITGGSDERRRSTLIVDGREGIELVYEDQLTGYVYVNRLFAVGGRFVQASAAYYRGLSDSSVQRQVDAFFDSIRFGAAVSP